MATQRAKAHRDLVHYEENAKRSLRATAPIECLRYLDRAAEAWNWYVQYKKKKQPRGTAGGCMNGN